MPIIFSTLNHPKRSTLAAEIHSRPPVNLNIPEKITHLAISGRNDIENKNLGRGNQTILLAAFCDHFGVASPSSKAKYFYHNFGGFSLKWECHTEFASYTFFSETSDEISNTEFFKDMPLIYLPESWLISLKDKLIVASHLIIKSINSNDDDLLSNIRNEYGGNIIIGSDASSVSQLWTDFKINSDGFVRFVVFDKGLKGFQAGRLVQSILEIETYRMLALFGLPNAHKTIPILNNIEEELALLTSNMVNMNKTGNLDEDINIREEQALLEQITSLASRLEELVVDNNYRFSASKAYFNLVNDRIEELREKRIEGIPTIAEFLDKRLTPAMKTCDAVVGIQEALEKRISNTNALLRTRVSIRLEQQNSKILESLNSRAAQQLRLQQAVEGLSAAAITYYLVGLLDYFLKAGNLSGFSINSGLLTGISVPIIGGIVWYGLRKIRKKQN